MRTHAQIDFTETIEEIELADETVAAAAPEPETPFIRQRGLFRQALRYGRTRVGLGILGIMLFLAIFGGFFAPHSPYVFIGPDFSAPTANAPLGADYLGRDLLSRFLNGGHVILLLSVLGTLLGVGGGTVIGLVAGYKRNAIDEILMRIMDLVLSFPNLVLALLLITVIGSHDWILVVIVGVTFMPQTARVIRAVTMQIAQSDFVKYAEGTGMPTWRVLAKEILPNVTPALTVEFGIRFTNAIGLLAGLDYLGFGVQAPTPDWGLMIQENQLGLTVRPLAVLLPVAAIALLAVGANLVTDGIGRAASGADRTIEG